MNYELKTKRYELKFTGQWYDSESGDYWLRARIYSPRIYRFTSRDLIWGKFQQPLSLHKYLYCENEPVNRVDPWGLLYTPVGGPHYSREQTQHIIDYATKFVQDNPVTGWIRGFVWNYLDEDGDGNPGGRFDYWSNYNLTFEIASYRRALRNDEFSNYLAGHTSYYALGLFGEACARIAGHIYSLKEYGELDDWHSQFFITKGSLEANLKAQDYYKQQHESDKYKPFFNRDILRWDETRLRHYLQWTEAGWFYQEATGSYW